MPSDAFTEITQLITNPRSLMLKIADAIHTFAVHGIREDQLRMGFSPLVERIIFEELVNGRIMGLASGVEGGSIKSLYGVACDSFWPWNKIVVYGKHSYLNNDWIIEIAVEHPAKEAFEMKPARFPANMFPVMGIEHLGFQTNESDGKD